MWQTFRLVNRIESTIKINAILYFIKQIPIIREIFKNIGIDNYGLKKKLSSVALAVDIIRNFIIAMFILAIGIGVVLYKLPDYGKNLVVEDAFMHMFFCFYFLLAGLGNVSIFEKNENKYIYVKMFRINAKHYFFSQFIMKRIWSLLGELPVFLFLVIYFGGNALQIVLLLIARNIFSCFGEMLHILLFEKTGFILMQNIALSTLLKFVFIASGYVPILLFSIPHYDTTAVIIIGLLGAILGLAGFRYLLNYSNYYFAFDCVSKLEDLAVDVQQIQRDYAVGNLELEEKSHAGKSKHARNFEKSFGFDYLNDLFFSRHKNVIYQPVMFQSLSVLALFLAGMLVSFKINGFGALYEETIMRYYTFGVLFMYGMSNARRVTKAMFLNCDMSLLRYGFYKKDTALLATFVARLRKLCASNMVPALAFAGAMLLLNMVNGRGIAPLLPVAILVVVLSFFFSVHNLFLYYILQPYNSEKDVSKPIFAIMHSITGILCYMCTEINAAPVQFLTVIAVITAVYMVAASILVYRYAPKTFRLW